MKCVPNPSCKYLNGEGCGTNIHHLYWPRAEYKTRVEKDFRGLGCNLIELCKAEHDELHATQLPPEKPLISEMQSAISRYQIPHTGLNNNVEF